MPKPTKKEAKQNVIDNTFKKDGKRRKSKKRSSKCFTTFGITNSSKLFSLVL